MYGNFVAEAGDLDVAGFRKTTRLSNNEALSALLLTWGSHLHEFFRVRQLHRWLLSDTRYDSFQIYQYLHLILTSVASHCRVRT